MIRTDPVTGRRFVLAYVELGTRVIEAMHGENCRSRTSAKSGYAAVRYRAFHALQQRAWKTPTRRRGADHWTRFRERGGSSPWGESDAWRSKRRSPRIRSED